MVQRSLTLSSLGAEVRRLRWHLLAFGAAACAGVIEWSGVPRLDTPNPPSVVPSAVIATLCRDLVHPFRPPTDLYAPALERMTLLQHTNLTLRKWALGFAIGVGTGSLLGFVLGSSRTAYAFGFPVANLLRSIPSTALWSALAWLVVQRYGLQVAIVAVGSLWPVLIGTASAIRGLPNEVIDSVAFMKIGWMRRSHLLVRWSAPGILTGVEVAAGVALLLAVTVELIDMSQGGIGWYLQKDANLPSKDTVFAGCVLIAAVGLVINGLAQQARHRYGSWGETDESASAPAVRAAWILVPRAVAVKMQRAMACHGKRDKRLDPLLRANVVTRRIAELWGGAVTHTLLFEGSPPYMVPGRVRELWDPALIWQRDVIIRAGTPSSPVLFGRSWSNLQLIPEDAANEIRSNSGTLGEVLAKRCSPLAYVDHAIRVEISEDIGRAFGTAGVLRAVVREREVSLAGRCVAVIHEFVPTEPPTDFPNQD